MSALTLGPLTQGAAQAVTDGTTQDCLPTAVASDGVVKNWCSQAQVDESDVVSLGHMRPMRGF